MNQLVPVKPKSVLIDMSDRYGMEPAAFEATVRATCLPPDRKTGRVPSREEFAAFLLVAREYRLNPVTREIFAFMAKHGGIVPVVSVDGWLNLVNSHKECDGFSFEIEHDDKGGIVACTCRMYRKDRTHPVEVTEYFAECKRDTDPWKSMPHRMIRHKAMIQAARYAFGFSGIYDEDEGRTIAEAVDVTPKAPLRVPSPNDVEPEGRDDPDHGSDKYRPGDVVSAVAEKSDPITTGPQPKVKAKGEPNIDDDYDGWFSWCLDKLVHAESAESCDAFFQENIEPVWDKIFPGDVDELAGAQKRTQEKYAP